MNRNLIETALIFFGSLLISISGHEITVSIPAYRRVGESATLLCEYDLKGEGLYSVKWFKDGIEFYRFMPRSLPPKLVFHDVPGVHVNLDGSDERLVRLERLDIKSTGYYHCEVSEEAPSFRTSSGGGSLVVVELASEDPYISGQDDVYREDGVIELNCTSHRSKPAAVLMWFVNQKPVSSRYLKPLPVKTLDNHLQSSSLGLELPISRHLFRSGLLRLTCAAYIQAYNYASESDESRTERRRLVKGQLIQRRQTSFLIRSSAASSCGEQLHLLTLPLLILLQISALA